MTYEALHQRTIRIEIVIEDTKFCIWYRHKKYTTMDNVQKRNICAVNSLVYRAGTI
jgi:hypothetical protein